jgi:hypothetical protein
LKVHCEAGRLIDLNAQPHPTKLSYLTVQDILWINLQVTKQTNAFNYALLEEAVYYQYAYGDSDELTAQAIRFLNGFVAKKPIEAGNEATAFVAFAAFLMLNRMNFQLADREVVAWFRSPDAGNAISELEHGESYGDSVRDVVTHILKVYPATVEALAGRAVPVVVDGAIH